MAGRPRRPQRTVDRQRAAALQALADGLSVSAAALKSGVPTRTLYNWRDDDALFAKAWDDALDAGTDRLADEARRRAFDGVDEPVFYKGEAVGAVRKYSDTLLMFLLRARKPAVYRDATIGADGAGLSVTFNFGKHGDPDRA